MLHIALTRPNVRCLFVALTRSYAKDLVWDLLLEYNETYHLEGKPHGTELRIRFPNGSSISLVGANHEKEIRKIKGKKFACVFVDEYHIFPNYGRGLIDEVLAPATAELNAPIVVLWTPPPALIGPAVETWSSPSWTKFEWTLADNPYFESQSGKTAAQWIKDECARRGVSADDPIILREAYGKLIEDPDSLAYKYSIRVNDYQALPHYTSTILGVDIGYNDADAISALTWDDAGNGDVYIAEDETESHQDDRQLSIMLKRFIVKYNPIKIVVDTAGNRKTFESVKHTLRLEGVLTPMEPRPILPVADQVGIMNDALRSGRLHARADSTFAQDCLRVTWQDGIAGGKLAKNPHSDAIPAATNALVAALSLLPDTAAPPSDEELAHALLEAAQEAKAARRRQAERQNGKPRPTDDFEDWGADDGEDWSLDA